MRGFLAVLFSLLLAFPVQGNNLTRPGMRGPNGGSFQPAPIFITPGSTAYGSWALTAQPADQGSSSNYGYYDNAIAVWDTVPFQTFSGTMQTCVAAFHAPTAAEYAQGISNNIDHVDFAINGGAWTSVYTQTTNTMSGMLEYCASVRASDFAADGKLEERAIVYPKTGVPLILQGSPLRWNGQQYDAQAGVVQTYNNPSIKSLTLNANSHGTLPTYTVYADSVNGNDANDCKTKATACQTIRGATGNSGGARDKCYSYITAAFPGSDLGGCTILLEAGNYNIGSGASSTDGTFYNSASQWVTIAPDTGVGTSAVIDCQGSTAGYVSGSAATTCTGNHYGLNTNRMHLQGVMVRLVTGSDLNTKGLYGHSVGGLQGVWADNVTFLGDGSQSAQPIQQQSFNYGVYMTNSNVSFMQNGCTYCDLVSNSVIHDIVSDSFQNSYAVIGSTSYKANGTYTAYGATQINTGDITSGSPVVTNVVDISQIHVGANIGDAPFPSTTVASVGVGNGCVASNCFVMNANATSTATAQGLNSGAHPDLYQFNGTSYSGLTYGIGSNIITGFANLFYVFFVGSPISGTNIPPYSYITQVCRTGLESGCSVANSVIISSTPTGSGSSVTVGRANVLLYGVQSYQSKNQGWFFGGGPVKDHALVNSNLCNQSNDASCNTAGVTMFPNNDNFQIMQLSTETNNMIFINSTLNGPTTYRTDIGFKANDVTLVNTYCPHGATTNRATAISVSNNLVFQGGTC